MSTHVVGFKDPDDRYLRLLAVWETCHAAGVRQPQEVLDFFGESAENRTGPDPTGVETSIPSHDWRQEMRQGLEVVLAELPPGVTKIRFYNSW